MSALHGMFARAVAPLGSATTRLAWRFAGAAMVLHWLQAVRSASLVDYLEARPLGFHVAGLGGLLLVALGPRLALLVPLAIAWAWLCYAVPAGAAGPIVKVVDEYALFALLPLLAVASALVTWSERHPDDRARRAEAAGQKWVLRIGASATLGFAALHKLNTDFLDPATTCANLAARLGEFWAVPAPTPAPWLLVALEGLAVPLLWFYPRLGLLWTIALVAGLGHIGPAAFNTLILAAALAFVPERDAEALAPALHRRGAWLAVLGLVLWPASFALYRGPNNWTIFAIFQAALLLAACLVAVGLRDAVRVNDLSPRRSRLRLPGGPRHRGFAVATLAVVIGLGLSPYLGLKYRYSFAMLSNLRADDARWNSLIVPSWVRLTRHDPFVHVLRVEPAVPRSKKGEAVLAPGVYTPDEFRRRFDAARRQKRRSALELRYQGQSLKSPDLAADLNILGFAASLPARPLEQPALTLRAAQPCIH
ncbi:hypothetical protein [Nannocystis punicea]|uniref:Vitamin K-dependent gamma-carboxylase n=1 Tax=Nannocystis punicea TaxID=2995304 RepID=A0ABY7GW99_9BACT|nr:hypothetical protein [Nannocystis poenicansa]WAS91237.1 hypothetical protein O0S08_34040 [Nannocystis poenicansa]